MGPLGLELELDPGLEWNNLTQNKNGTVGPGIRMGQLDLGLKWAQNKNRTVYTMQILENWTNSVYNLTQ